MTPTVEERVAKGIEWLNHQDRLEILDEPWWDKIDLEEFSLSSPCNCVLGQLAYELIADDHWSLNRNDFSFYDVQTVYGVEMNTFDCGFQVDYTEEESTWEELDAEWRKQILSLKAG